MTQNKQSLQFGRYLLLLMCCLWCWCELAKAGEQIYFSKGVFGLLMNLEPNKLEFSYLVVIFNCRRGFNVLDRSRTKC